MRRASASLAIVVIVAATTVDNRAGARQRPASQPADASRLGGAATPSGAREAVVIRNRKTGRSTFAVLDAVSGPNNTVAPEIDVAMLENGSGDFGVNAGLQYKTLRFGTGVSHQSNLSLDLVGAADFNNDGADDLAFIDFHSNVAAVALNDGTNFFLPPQFRETGGLVPVSAAIGDVNNDDRLDLVVAGQGAPGVPSNQSLLTTLLGDGNGGLQPSGKFLQLPRAGLSIVGGLRSHAGSNLPQVVDFNNDGFPDFAVASTGGGVSNVASATPNVTLLLNNPSSPGTFSQFPIALVTEPRAIQAVDLNDDGQTDLVVGSSVNLEVLPGLGNGTFGASLSTPLSVSGRWPGAPPVGLGGANYTMAVGDFNADGSPDLIVNGTSIVLNQTRMPGSVPFFLPPVSAFSSDQPLDTPQYVFGDFNDDGVTDPILVTRGSARIVSGTSIPAMQPGRPASPTGPNLGLRLSTVADVNGDDKPDIVGVATQKTVTGVVQNTLRVHLGLGDATFGLPAETAPLPGFPVSIDAGDINGDGKTEEFAVALAGRKPLVNVFTFGADGPQLAHTEALSGQPIGVTVGRLNGDALADIAFITSQPGADDLMTILPARKAADSTALQFGGSIGGPIVKDKTHFFVSYDQVGDADATADLFVATSNGVQVFETMPNPDDPLDVDFGAPAIVAPGTSPIGVVVSDVNRDNLVDVIALNRGSGNISVHVATSSGYAASRSISVGANPLSISIIDFNNDLTPDIAVAQAPPFGGGQINILRGSGTGEFVRAGSFVGLNDFTFPDNIFSEDVNNDGHLDLLSPRLGTSYQIGERTLLKANYALYDGDLPVGEYRFTAVVSDLDADNIIDLNEVFQLNGDPCAGSCLAPFNLQSRSSVPVTPGDLAVDPAMSFSVPVVGGAGSELPAAFDSWEQVPAGGVNDFYVNGNPQTRSRRLRRAQLRQSGVVREPAIVAFEDIGTALSTAIAPGGPGHANLSRVILDNLEDGPDAATGTPVFHKEALPWPLIPDHVTVVAGDPHAVVDLDPGKWSIEVNNGAQGGILDYTDAASYTETITGRTNRLITSRGGALQGLTFVRAPCRFAVDTSACDAPAGTASAPTTRTVTLRDLQQSKDAADAAYLNTAKGFVAGATPSTEFQRTTNGDGSVTYTASNTSHTVLPNPGGGLSVRMPSGATVPAAPTPVTTTSVTVAELQQSQNPLDLAYFNTASGGVLANAIPSARVQRTTNADGSVTYTASNSPYTVIPNPAGGLNVRLPNGKTVPAVGGQGGLDAAARLLADATAACTGGGCTAVPSLPDSCGPGEFCTDLMNLTSCQGCTQIGGNNPGDRDPSVQYMIVEVVLLKAAQLAAEPPSLARVARTLWDALRAIVSGDPSLAARSHSLAGPGRVNTRWQQTNRQQPAGGGAGMSTLLTSLGTSTGEAFEIQVANDGKQPINLTGNGVVVEPLKRGVAQQARQQISRLASRHPITQKLDAYCLEMLRQPPSVGTIFRVASPELQTKFAPMRRVLQAGQRLQQAGLLKPDSDPKGYFPAIKQWALWTRERSFDEKSYGDAFVDHTKKNATEAGVQWTRQIEDGIRGLVPGRWKAITQILQAADQIR